jgi:hypothetical protein
MAMLALLLAAAANPPPPTREVFATLTVRVQVAHTCIVSATEVRCRGAAGQPPVRVVTTPCGVTIVEF